MGRGEVRRSQSECPCGRIETIQSILGADPDCSVSVLVERVDVVVAETGRVPRIMHVLCETAGALIVHADAAANCAHPNRPFLIDHQPRYVIVRQGGRVLWIVPEHLERIPVIPIQAVLRTEPKETEMILSYGKNG